jgi:hypothetical protein
MITTDPNVIKLLTEVLADFSKKQIIFSAYDVTKECRNRVNKMGNPFYVSHDAVRDTVHHFYDTEIPPFENGSDYVRENYYGPQNDFQVYRPVGVDIHTYDPDAIQLFTGQIAKFVPSKAAAGVTVQSKSGTAVALAAPAKPGPAPQPVKPVQDATLHRRSRGRVLIPSAICAKAKLYQGEEVNVYQNGNQLTICVADLPTNIPLATLTVDKYGELRLSSSILDHIGATASFDVRADNGGSLFLTPA